MTSVKLSLRVIRLAAICLTVIAVAPAGAQTAPSNAPMNFQGRALISISDAHFDHFNDSRPGGSIDFWRVDRDPLNPRPLLVRTTHNVPVTCGPHSIVLAR